MSGRALSRTRRRDALATVALFERCTKKELDAVAELTTEISLEPGRVLCREGEIGGEFFVIVDGTATLVQRGRDIRRVGAGSAIGEMALLDSGPRTATVRAATPMTVLVLNRREFDALLLRAPSVARKLLVVLGGRLRTAEKVIGRLEARLAKQQAAGVRA
jgi:CRP/FNR family transcriptional regulator, cyclic AMP receptor protein